ncbi:MAG: hypothetical protein K1X94_20490 [Sandaracinaceae bacterium]|nr:hypothetical protein [Sandaracinaceae bacterium]
MRALATAASILVVLALVSSAPGRVLAQIGTESVGMNTHVPADDVLDACVDAGVAWVRIDANWRDLHRGPGSFDFAEMERVARSASARGLHVFVTLAYTPDWVPRVDRPRTDAYGGNDEPLGSSEWVEFVDAIVRRLRPLGITHYGLWNEANLDGFWEEAAGLDAWVDKIVLPGAAAVRAACPDCRVLGPELANVGPSDVALDVVLSRTAGTWDIVTHHTYQAIETSGGSDSIDNALVRRRSPLSRASLRELLDLHGVDREVWITETGYRADPPGSTSEEGAQRDYVLGALDRQRAHAWWTNTFFYEIVDCGIDQPGCDIDGFGLLRPARPASGGPRAFPADYRQKPAFVALRERLDADPELLGGGPTHTCDNGLDDDADGHADLADRGCANEHDDDESDDPARRSLEALRNPTDVVLDGRLDEWSADGFVTLDLHDWFASAIGLLGPIVANDLGVELGARWSGETLFLAVRVSDDAHVADETAERMYLDDSIQLAFDPDASGGRGYDGDDEEWGCIARAGGVRRFAGDGEGVLCVTSREGRTTSYELAIPHAAIPEASFGASARLRFSMLVNEDDGADTRDGTGREGWLELTRSIGAFKDPGSFGEIVLVDREALRDVDAGPRTEPDASTWDGDAGRSVPHDPGAGCSCRASGATRSPATLVLLGLALAVVRAPRARSRRKRETS